MTKTTRLTTIDASSQVKGWALRGSNPRPSPCKAAVQAAADSASEGNAVMAGNAMAASYAQMRPQVRATIPADPYDEFDALFPESLGGFASGPLGDADRFHAAKTKLTAMPGWLGGFVEEAKVEMQARADAAERAKAARGVGFKGSDK